MNPIQKLLATVCAAAMLLFSSGASAVPITITAASFLPGAGYGIDTNEASGTSLDVRFSTSLFTQQDFALNAVNQSNTFNFGTINLAEPNAHGGIVSNETDFLGVTTSLSFTNPTVGTKTITATGTATTGAVSDAAIDYFITWNPVTILFGDGGSFRLSLHDLSFSGPGSQIETATFTLLSLPSLPSLPSDLARADVPEPASTALLGIGIAGVAFARRRRAKAQSC